MKFLLDQGLPRSTVQLLQGMGFQAEHVGDLELATATDETILREGKSRHAIVVTLDADFHALLTLSNAPAPSVIRIRVQGLKGAAVAEMIRQVTEAATNALNAGAAVTVSDRRIAIRLLPMFPPEERLVTDENGS